MAWLGYGQLVAQTPLLRQLQQAPGWTQYPETYQRGLAAAIRPPAPGAWTPPEALGRVTANLGRMWKALEGMQRDELLGQGNLSLLGLRAVRTAVGVEYRPLAG